MDGGGYYNAQWRITNSQPTQEDIDRCGNSKILFMGTIGDIFSKRKGSLCKTCDDAFDYKHRTGYGKFIENI